MSKLAIFKILKWQDFISHENLGDRKILRILDFHSVQITPNIVANAFQLYDFFKISVFSSYLIWSYTFIWFEIRELFPNRGYSSMNSSLDTSLPNFFSFVVWFHRKIFSVIAFSCTFPHCGFSSFFFSTVKRYFHEILVK